MLVTRFVFETWALQPGYNSVIFKIKQSNTNYLQQLMWNSHCWWYAATLGAIMLISWCQQLLQWLLCNQLRLSRVQYRHFPHSASFQHSHDKCWHESACLTKNNHKAFWATVKAVQVLQEWEKAASAWCCSDFEEIGPFQFHRYINLWLCFVFLTKRCNTTLLDSLTSGFILLSSSSYCTLHLY